MPDVLNPSSTVSAPENTLEKNEADTQVNDDNHVDNTNLNDGPEFNDTAAVPKSQDAADRPFDDIMFGIDYLQDKKRERDVNGIIESLNLIGELALGSDSERESLCDFEGITAMSEVVRHLEECCRIEIEGVESSSSSESNSSLVESLRNEKREIDLGDDAEDEADEHLLSDEELLKRRQEKAAKKKEAEERKARRSIDIYMLYLKPGMDLYNQYHMSMSTFCKSMKGVCLKSNLNRGALRDEGIVEEVVGFLEFCKHDLKTYCLPSTSDTPHPLIGLSNQNNSTNKIDPDSLKSQLLASVSSACIAIKALCSGNDGNKKAASNISGKFNAEGLSKTDCLDPSVPTMAKDDSFKGKGVDILLEFLSTYSSSDNNLDNQSVKSCKTDATIESLSSTNGNCLSFNDEAVLTHAVWALRSLITDDDTRGMESMVPSAVENRDYCCDRIRFPKVREIVVTSFRGLKKDMDARMGKKITTKDLEEEVERMSKASDGADATVVKTQEGSEGQSESNPDSSTTNSTSSTKKSSPLSPLQWYRLEGVLLLMKEVGCHQERIHKFVFEDNVLPLIKDTLAFGHISIVRACLYVLRQFAFSDHMKELFTAGNSAIAKTCMLVLKKYSDNTSIVEQSFGLFSNLTLRKPAICHLLHAEPLRLSAQAQFILQRFGFTHGGICTTVLFTLRNVAKSVPDAAKEMDDSGIFKIVRDIYFKHEHNGSRQWCAAKDIGKQFLREFREDSEGMRRSIEWNEYY